MYIYIDFFPYPSKKSPKLISNQFHVKLTRKSIKRRKEREKNRCVKTGDELRFLVTWLTFLIYKCIQYDDGNPCASRPGWNYGPRILRSLAWHDIDWLPITPQIKRKEGCLIPFYLIYISDQCLCLALYMREVQ